MMIITLKVNGERIKELNIPISNPDFKLDKKELAQHFQEFVEAELCVEA